MGILYDHDKFLAFRVKLHTVHWNAEGDRQWNFGIGHDFIHDGDHACYENDFQGMAYTLREKLTLLRALFRAARLVPAFTGGVICKG